MKYEYDVQSDTLLIKLSNQKPEFGEQEGNVITHYSKDYKPVEIEILDASKAAEEIMHAILSEKRKPTPSAH